MKTFVIFSALLTFQIANAYILPSQFILQDLEKKSLKLKNINLESTILDLRTKSIFQENLKIDFGQNKISGELTNASGLSQNFYKVYDSLGNLAKTWFYLGLSFQRPKSIELLNQLKLQGGDLNPTKLFKFQKSVFYTWGINQSLFLQKDNSSFGGFKSLGNDGESIELMVSSYSTENSRVPKTILIKKGNIDLYQYELKAFKINTNLKILESESNLTDSDFLAWSSLVR